MLLVETYLDRSDVAGIGVFTRHRLPAGTCVWAAHASVDLSFSPEQWERWLEPLSEAIKPDMRRHSYKQGGRIVLCIDNARFMNHGGERSNVQDAGGGERMVACRDIEAGSELLCDYFEYSDADDAHLPHLDP